MIKNYKEEMIKIVGNALDGMNLKVDDCFYEKEGKINCLRVVLDSPEVITIDMIVEATKIINPLLDKHDLIKEKYILDVYGKAKGE